jgi:hypothetical protein
MSATSFTYDKILFASLDLQISTISYNQDDRTEQISKVALAILSRNQDYIHSSSQKDVLYQMFSLKCTIASKPLPAYLTVSKEVPKLDLLKAQIASKIFFKEQVYQLDENSVHYLIRASNTSLDEGSDVRMFSALKNRVWLSSAKLLSLPYSALKDTPPKLFFSFLKKLEVKAVRILMEDETPLNCTREWFDTLSRLDAFDFTIFIEMFTVKFAEDLSFQVPKAVLLSHKWFQNCFNAGMSENVTKLVDFSTSEKVSQRPDLYYLGFREFVYQLQPMDSRPPRSDATLTQVLALALPAFLNDVIPVTI